MQNDKRFYVYAHMTSDSDNANDVFYIGKGTGDRYKRKNNRGPYWNNFVKSINNKYYTRILEDNLTTEMAIFKEMIWIDVLGKKIDGGLLVNLTNGGEGMLGYKASDLTRKKISESNKGKIVSNELKAHYSKLFSGKGNPRYGANVSIETREKISNANKGKLEGIKHPKYKGCILELDVEGNVLNKYTTAKEVSVKYGIAESTVRSALNGYRKSVGKIILKREKDYQNL
jgi:hypothetical protein